MTELEIKNSITIALDNFNGSISDKEWVSAESLISRLKEIIIKTVSRPERYDSETLKEIKEDLKKLLKELEE